MRRTAATLVAAALLLLSAVGPAAGRAGTIAPSESGNRAGAPATDGPDPSGRWIVLYKNGTDAAPCVSW